MLRTFGTFQYMLLLRGATILRAYLQPCLDGFNTCSSCEEQPFTGIRFPQNSQFQYMLLLRGATTAAQNVALIALFQYMLLLRGATMPDLTLQPFMSFQYMLLLRGATFLSSSLFSPSSGFNTCSSCEEQRRSSSRHSSRHRFNTCSSCEEQL